MSQSIEGIPNMTAKVITQNNLMGTVKHTIELINPDYSLSGRIKLEEYDAYQVFYNNVEVALFKLYEVDDEDDSFIIELSSPHIQGYATTIITEKSKYLQSYSECLTDYLSWVFNSFNGLSKELDFKPIRYAQFTGRVNKRLGELVRESGLDYKPMSGITNGWLTKQKHFAEVTDGYLVVDKDGDGSEVYWYGHSDGLWSYEVMSKTINFRTYGVSALYVLHHVRYYLESFSKED